MEKHNTGSLLSSSHQYWSRLRDLFSFIDKGQEQLGVYEYNGGLFDSDRHPFFKENSIGDKYIAEAIRKVSYSEAEGGFIDYQELDVRELGAIYEGLLEHKPVIEEEQVKWEEDLSERKKTGSYYTPEYIVKYIVENTIDPLVEEKKEEIEEEINELKEKLKGSRGYDRETYQRKLEEKRKEVRKEILDLKILDPAMGSGHFLVEATEKLANSIASLEEEFSPDKEEKPKVQETEKEDTVKELKRQIVERSIYGVDKNPLATELAKLSLWLHTVAKGEPLSFLDHHLRTGDSLIGIDIEEMKTMPSEREQSAGLFTSNLVQDLGNAIGHLNLIEEITSESRDDVQEKKAEWRDVRGWIDKYKKAANVRLSTSFGNEVSDDEYRKVLQSAANNDMELIKSKQFFQEVQEMADDKSFFHWELEFPDIFRNSNGKKKREAGFDVIIGNPPYVKIQNIENNLRDYYQESYKVSKGRYDLYGIFLERSTKLSRKSHVAMILPNKFFESNAGESLREFLLKKNILKEVTDFGIEQVFPEVTTYTCILITRDNEPLITYKEIDELPSRATDLISHPSSEIQQEDLSRESFTFLTKEEKLVFEEILSKSTTLKSRAKTISEGIITGDNQIFVGEKVNHEGGTFTVNFGEEKVKLEEELVHPFANGENIKRFSKPKSDKVILYPYYRKNGKTEIIPQDELKDNYPLTFSYLSKFKNRLSTRGTSGMDYENWYALWCPRSKDLFESTKILTPDISERCEFALDQTGGLYIADTGYGIHLNP